MTALRTSYGPGSVTTETPGGEQSNLLSQVLERRLQGARPAAPTAPLGPKRVSPRITPPLARTGMTEGLRTPNANPRMSETPWYSLQGAATRLHGVGPGMIPGMMADVTKLPPHMRPNEAQIVSNGSAVPTGSIQSPDMNAAAQQAQTTGQGAVDADYERYLAYVRASQPQRR